MTNDSPIHVSYYPGDPEGDCSAMAFYKNKKCIGQLVGEAAEYVYHALHQLDALIEDQRGESNE